jgi:biotin operon repressor
MVEIALGPKGAFEYGNIGALTRRVPTDRVVTALPPLRGNPKPPMEPKTPRVVELLRKALEWQALLESGEFISQADIAHREGITRARVTQVMGMLRLATGIQEYIQSLPGSVRRPSVTERALRPIAQHPQGRDQLHAFQEIITPRTWPDLQL